MCIRVNAYALEQVKFTPYVRGGTTSIHLSFLEYIRFLCSVSVLQVKMDPLLDALKLMVLFAGTLTYLGPKLFFSKLFYNGALFLVKY
jgi:hypothetical protein